MEKNNSVDGYILKKDKWQNELKLLRRLLNATELEETVKWGSPCYTINGKNVVSVGAFKEFVALWFFQGALLKDKDKVLINAQEGTTKALRQWRFFAVDEIHPQQVQKYVKEAIENQKLGREILPQRKKSLVIPLHLSEALRGNSNLKTCFDQFTTGKQREFADYIASAKRIKTRKNRLQKIIPMLLRKEGLNDRYKK